MNGASDTSRRKNTPTKKRNYTMKKTMYRLALAATAASLVLISVPVFASDIDDRIESSAKQSYVFKTYLKDDDIEVRSKNGVVTLTGTVSEETGKSLARETVASLPEVKSVDDKLQVKGEAPAVHSDAWLITKVKANLLFHRNVSAIATEVLAKDGTVTLRGEATSKAQKDLANEYAKDVEGVKNVKNEMTVRHTAMKPGKKTMGERMDTMGETIDDASTTALVKTALLYHRSTSGINTTVETNKGVVKLGGKAKTAAEKDLAAKLVGDVHGVKNVINNMTVEGT
jgi:hyperosmotically inducible periplasmic protein